MGQWMQEVRCALSEEFECWQLNLDNIDLSLRCARWGGRRSTEKNIIKKLMEFHVKYL